MVVEKACTIQLLRCLVMTPAPERPPSVLFFFLCRKMGIHGYLAPRSPRNALLRCVMLHGLVLHGLAARYTPGLEVIGLVTSWPGGAYHPSWTLFGQQKACLAFGTFGSSRWHPLRRTRGHWSAG